MSVMLFRYYSDIGKKYYQPIPTFVYVQSIYAHLFNEDAFIELSTKSHPDFVMACAAISLNACENHKICWNTLHSKIMVLKYLMLYSLHISLRTTII